MNYQVRPPTQRTISYGTGRSDPSSQGDNMDSYYDEARYLSKEQMKAYIYKMKKEIQDYKMREMNYKIEIKYLRRKIERLKGIIQNDTFFLHDHRGGSVRSHHSGFSFTSGMNKVNSEHGKHAEWYRRGNVSEGNYHHRVFTRNYDSARCRGGHDRNGSRNGSRNRSHVPCEDNLSEAKFSNVSMRSINASIHNSKRMSARKFPERFSDTCRRSDRHPLIYYKKGQENNNNVSGHMGRSSKLKNHLVRDHFVHPIPIPRKVKNAKPGEDGMVMEMRRGSDSFLSNRSCSCTSKFKVKSHLISNSKHMRNVSTHINSTIAKDIKSYYSSKQSILSGASQEKSNRNSSSLQKRPSAAKDVEGKTDSCGTKLNIENLSKLTPREIKKKFNCDLFDYAHHQRILSKKYTSPYAFKREKSVNRIASCDKAIQRDGCVVNVEEGVNGDDNGGMSDSGDSIKKVKQYLDQQRDMRNQPAMASTAPSTMPAVVTTSVKKHDGVSARGRAKEVTTGTVLISKGGEKNEGNSDAKGNNIQSRDGTKLKKKETKPRPNVLESVKKGIEADIKQNFKKELEELKRRKDILVSKRSDYCDLSFGSTSSSGSSRGRSSRAGSSHGGRKVHETVGNPGKAVNNPLKESNILNISFNDLDKRISNLKNYLKNTNA
ncbi:hypothetical protein AK88_00742 [Plasmodium fragile]|uniref:Uncharacterized protein n=1 Tax=Plasmodium fragile TaxID=5857 RepID=A0A0D9QTZ8_PLAFR|nr:uncharacterized protein AK88_00742 [Plasmodium fragile]KJP89531.1 hypothetical protein AK88_00742 [Plasmodium fragile]